MKRQSVNQFEDLRGMPFVNFKTRFLLIVSKDWDLIRFVLPDEGTIWLLVWIYHGVLESIDRIMDSLWLIESRWLIFWINHTRFGINDMGYWGDAMEYGVNYKRRTVGHMFITTISSLLFQNTKHLVLLLWVLVKMTQGQLLGKTGEGNRKRFKISVPHFDNSELI